MRVLLSILFFSTLIFSQLFFKQSIAATCSCAAVPLLSSVNATSAEDNQWVVAMSIQHQDVSELYSGTDSVIDDTGRDRFSDSAILQLDYGFNENWSATGVFSYVEHERTVGISDNSTVTSSGVGDSLFLLKYIPQRFNLFSSVEYSVGVGVKIPTGVNDNNLNGIILAEDMQPGTGAYSFIAMGYFSYALDPATRSRLFISANYSYNQENDRNYSFGDEVNITFGGSHYFETPWATTLQINYRKALIDERNNFEIPNTGGQWVDLIPSVQYVFDNSAIKLSGNIPIYRNLKGALQFTTKYSANLSYNYIF